MKASSNPSTLFPSVPSLQNMLVQKLLETDGNIRDLPEFKTFPIDILKNACRPTLIEVLSQAVIDKNLAAVKKILDFDPELLLIEPKDFGVTEIESKKTWQRFLTEPPFIMAQKLKRLEMVKTMQPYFEKVKNLSESKVSDVKDEKNEVISLKDKTQAQQDEKTPPKYMQYIKSLLDIIAADNEAKVTSELNNETKLEEAKVIVSEETELALEALRKFLLPDKAMAIDEYCDVEQFLMAAYKIYDEHLNLFQNNLDRRDVFAICVIGFVQSLISPELAKAYCEDLDGVANNKKPISKRAEDLELKDGGPFYRSSRTSRSGQGFTFYCSIYNGASTRASFAGDAGAALRAFGNLRQARDAELGRLTQHIQSTPDAKTPILSPKRT